MPTIPEKYHTKNFTKKLDDVQQSYDAGDLIEAFGLLSCILEFKLMETWNLYLVRDLGDQYEAPSKNWDFKQCLDILHQVKLIDSDQYSIFMNFNNGRNKVVHELSNPMKNRNIDKNFLGSSFKNGLIACSIIHDVQSDIQLDIGRFRING